MIDSYNCLLPNINLDLILPCLSALFKIIFDWHLAYKTTKIAFDKLLANK